MKRTFKFVSVIMAIVMIMSVMAGITVSAADVTYASSESQSSMKNVALSNGTITGTYNIWGYVTALDVYVGNGTTGTNVFSETYTAGSISIASDINFTAALSDGGASTSGYTVKVSANNGNWASAYIPYSGPSYLMEIRRNDAAVSAVTIGLNEGTASGFSFVYENGGSYTYSVDNSNIITVAKSGDTFTITPVAVGTATITAVCNSVSSATLTVTVADDSTLTAQWYDTGAAIANGATLSGQATVTYGFGVEAYPDNYTVTLSNNTANAVYTSSAVAGQYPNSIVAANEGSVKVTIAGQTKTIAFTVNFTAAPEPVFGFYTDSACTAEAEPLVAVEKGASVTIYANESVAKWTVASSDITYTTTATSITATGVTVDATVKVTAYDADNNELGWFDFYVTAAEEEPVDPEPTLPDAYVFKVGDKNAYWTTYDYAFTCDVPCQFVDSVTYVPFRIIATAAGASNITYSNGAIAITTKAGYVYNLTIASKDCTLVYQGAEYPGTLNSAPQFIDGVCCLPVRDVSNITGASVAFVSQDGAGYVIVSDSALSSEDATTVINAYEAKF